MGWRRGSPVRGPRTPSSLALPRMNAHRLVIIAAALTMAVAAAMATALAIFSGQGLPRAVRQDLSAASGTSLVINGSLSASQAAQYTSRLPGQISQALDGTPFAFYRASWSDPLGFVPGSKPEPPASTGNVLIAEAAALDGITGHTVLVSGTWPGAPAAGQPIPAALPATAAALLHVGDGDVLRMQDRISGRYDRFVITGLYRPRQVSSQYWGLDDVALAGSSTVGGFTTYGPLTVQAAAFAGPGPLAVEAASWLAQPHMASVPAGELTIVAGQVQQLQRSLQIAQGLPSLTLTTGMPSVLTGIAANLDVARSLLAICTVLVFLLVAAALLAAARLLAGQREGEYAMLTARGATRWQLLRLTAAEAIPLALVSAAVGAVLGVLLARLLVATGGVPVNDVWPAAVVAAGATVIMVVPALSTVTPGAARARRGRQAAISGVTRAGADLALVLLAVVAGWQLRHYSAVSAGANGTYGVDPVVVAAPALALAGGTVAALRLLPLGGKAGDRLAARGRRLTAALASWQISRQPVRQGGAALLVVLAVATGTLTLSQRDSWTGSEHDQGTFNAGADVRVQTSAPLSVAQAGALAHTPGVQHAMPVATFAQPTIDAQTMALDTAQAAGTVLLRPDQSSLAEPGLFGKIRPTGSGAGLTLPGRPARFLLTARLGPPALGLAPALVTVSVQDAASDAYQLNAGTLAADGQAHILSVSLSGGAREAVYPLRLTAVSLAYTLPSAPRLPATFTVDSVSTGPGQAQIPGTALRGWPAVASSAELSDVLQTGGTQNAASAPPAVTSVGGTGHGPLTVRFAAGYGSAKGADPGSLPGPIAAQLALSAPARVTVVPGLATQRFLAATNASLGSTVQTTINGTPVGVKIVATVATFPTVTGRGGALVIDLGALQDILTAGSLPPAQATQWWLATSPGVSGVPPGLAVSLPPGSAVTSAAGLAARLLADPLSTVPQRALLAVAIAAAALAMTGFCVSIAAGVRQRRAENALLAALGVPPRTAAAQLCLEKLMLSVPAALAGLILGVVLAELLVPAVTLTSAATTPMPPVIIGFGWAQTLPLALAVAVLPVLAAALTIMRRPDAAAELRAAESA
jgi:FtsX-like permease family